MPQLKSFDIDPVDVDADGIAQVQTPGAAGNLTLNGALVSGGVYTSGNGGGTQISVTTAANDSARTLTVTGTDADGRAQTETFTGAQLNATTTESSLYWNTVTQIAIDDAAAGNISVGTVDEVASAMWMLDRHVETGALVQLDVTGTIDVTVQGTATDVNLNFKNGTYSSQDDVPWVSASDSNIVGATADAWGRMDAGATALRVIVNSYSSGAEVQANISQRASGR